MLPTGVASAFCANRADRSFLGTHNLPTNIVVFRGFDSSIILILRCGILTSTGDFPGSLSQAMLVGTMLVGRLGILESMLCRPKLKSSLQSPLDHVTHHVCRRDFASGHDLALAGRPPRGAPPSRSWTSSPPPSRSWPSWKAERDYVIGMVI